MDSSSVVVVVIVVAPSLLLLLLMLLLCCCAPSSIVQLLIWYPVLWDGMLRSTVRMVVVTGVCGICQEAGVLIPHHRISHTHTMPVLDACRCWHGGGGEFRERVFLVVRSFVGLLLV